MRWLPHFSIFSFLFFSILLRVFVTKENERKTYSLIYFTHERENPSDFSRPNRYEFREQLKHLVGNSSMDWVISISFVWCSWKALENGKTGSENSLTFSFEIYFHCRMLLKDEWDCYCKEVFFTNFIYFNVFWKKSFLNIFCKSCADSQITSCQLFKVI